MQHNFLSETSHKMWLNQRETALIISMLDAKRLALLERAAQFSATPDKKEKVLALCQQAQAIKTVLDTIKTYANISKIAGSDD